MTWLVQGDDHVEVFVNEEPVGVYDLVIGADGLNSAVREMIGIEAKPEPTGMGIWRSFVSRPADVVRTELYYGGPVYIAGYTPTGEDTMYAFLVEKAQDRFGTPDEEATRIMLEESRAYDGPWNAIRADLERGAHANYTWFTKHLIEGPWNRGRVVVIGDAAHSCPPTIAQGAAQGLEDALVLTELLVAVRIARPGPVGDLPRAPPAPGEGRRRRVGAARAMADRRRPQMRDAAGLSSASRKRWRSPHDRAASPTSTRTCCCPGSTPRSSGASRSSSQRPPTSSAGATASRASRPPAR